MFELRERTLTKFFGDELVGSMLLEFPIENPSTPSHIVYNALISMLHKGRTSKKSLEIIKENIDKLTPEFASYLCLKFKNSLVAPDQILFFISQCSDPDYIGYYVSYIYRYSISKNKCDDQECYSVFEDLFSKRGICQDYVTASYYVLKKKIQPYVMECWIQKHAPVNTIHLRDYLSTFSIFFDVKIVEKSFALSEPLWKSSLAAMRKKYL